MNVLVLCDDYWHPAQTARAGLAPLEDAGFHFTFIENAADWSATRMAQHSVVLLAKANNASASDTTAWMTDEVQCSFLGYVQDGGGLLAVHSGTVGYAETPVLRALLGGVFVHHPPQCPVTVAVDAGHSLSTGVETFTLQDEHYHMAFDAADAALFMTAQSEHGTQPAGWTRRDGDGRVCVLTPGHNVEVWLHPSYQTLLASAVRWCAGTET